MSEKLREALEEIRQVASGEKQVAMDDTEGMAWIDKRAQAALAEKPAEREVEPDEQTHLNELASRRERGEFLSGDEWLLLKLSAIRRMPAERPADIEMEPWAWGGPMIFRCARCKERVELAQEYKCASSAPSADEKSSLAGKSGNSAPRCFPDLHLPNCEHRPPITPTATGASYGPRSAFEEQTGRRLTPAAPPVPQAEPDVERANKLLMSLGFDEDDWDAIALVEPKFAAIRREAERAAFEKAAQVADSHIKFYYSAANEIAAELRKLAQ